ncbi:malonyl-CoA decarboxylase [Thecamonas trahens ATCC 50062]|uniref:Malonyl-CoA decarboxylase n=1 Tax=Thecamonas trahens ATCC 50062 TaxID=461836 RepID=A0A0L0D4S8_THETB|nr:malonyl-CoA decarboxylase [Thecamonas trahens ATCC 50062]KNC47066.1 malonyl-CoA decarboxylase [Thecamonas trahens ATCC 50062]|eukprot:XP_013759846.1 malonyl-CoA decarboxylase [Thecamonas trahens ATCC 50062]
MATRLAAVASVAPEERKGDLQAQVAARELAEAYHSYGVAGKAWFLATLASEYGTSGSRVYDAITGWRSATVSGTGPREDRYFKAERALRESLVPGYDRLFALLRQQPGGMKFVVDLRRDVRSLLRAPPEKAGGLVAATRADLAALDKYMHSVLSSWFAVGALDLASITWDTPASTLEKIMDYERVHRMDGWEDLKQRLGPGRRCYAFFHPAMPDEPLIFVEVALLRSMASSIQDVLSEVPTLADEEASSTAIFYSISATQAGLAQIELGNFLIKRVVNALLAESSSPAYFATLSPIPGFSSWLASSHAAGELEAMLPPLGAVALATLDETLEAAPRSLGDALMAHLASPDWHKSPAIADALQATLLPLCARYLTSVRPPRAGEPAASALDPVANFHLRNGARVERINWLGDSSPRGLRQSAGLMVNYRYSLRYIDENNYRYANEGAITVSPAIADILSTVTSSPL